MTNNVLKNVRAIRLAAIGQYDLEIPDHFEKSMIRQKLYILHDIKQVYPARNDYAELFFAILYYPGDSQSVGLKSLKTGQSERSLKRIFAFDYGKNIHSWSLSTDKSAALLHKSRLF